MYNISVVYSDEDDVGIFNFATSWRFSDHGFLEIHWDHDNTTTFISKKSIQRMTVHEVQEMRR